MNYKDCDFSGYATKCNIRCSDGRIIEENAFSHQDGTKVPLVWMHQRNDPSNVLGHAYLENRNDGVYAYCKLNDSEGGKKARILVNHGDVDSLSIYANQLVEKKGSVMHGEIREVSLVIAGANRGALIDNIIQHASTDGDDYDYEDETQAVIYPGCVIDTNGMLEHSDDSETRKKKRPPVKMEDDEGKADEDVEDENDDTNDEPDDEDVDEEEEEKKKMKKENTKGLQHADDEDEDDDETVEDVYNAMTDKQKKVVAYMIGAALEAEDKDDDEAEHSDMEGDNDMRNVFDQNAGGAIETGPSLSHSDIEEIFRDAQKCGSLKESFLEHAANYGIENIDILFPDAKAVTNEPYMIKRDTEWVAGVLSETHHVPFSRIKSTAADITADEARAKGYVKGNLKKEEVIKLLKRVTTPTTVYKKQKLDRDDLTDITELDTVAWLKAEMRVMLNEELARSYLIGDGREPDDPDKINEDNIRPIWKDDDMYAHHVLIPADATMEEATEEVIRSRKYYKGSGSPTLYTTADMLVEMLLMKDKIGRRLYNSEAELASNLRVSKIVEVPVMEGATRDVEGKTRELMGIIVNLRDYTVGATQGGQISMFDDFDIDYNQYKYLIETRCCGALVMPKSAIVIEREQASTVGASETEIG